MSSQQIPNDLDNKEPSICQDTIMSTMRQAEVVLVVLDACARGIIKGDTIDIVDMIRPGTIVWIDPLTKEEKYALPGTRMYSTALMYAEYVIDEHGQRQPWPGTENKLEK